eukprot:CAMPEP_0116546264 /NCGR_PEP_ID=MMETSP0397-20121206/3133_1 /TAXON_ID=216820 /ORGANISM="Cyclophora tenuis, Strain ECT3854" /LENGTH=94 /DNA_ID=CAMNT_0004070681 /DNA_START=557 /DNA_END=841 /DNA_ORIENTATION=+
MKLKGDGTCPDGTGKEMGEVHCCVSLVFHTNLGRSNVGIFLPVIKYPLVVQIPTPHQKAGRNNKDPDYHQDTKSRHKGIDPFQFALGRRRNSFD